MMWSRSNKGQTDQKSEDRQEPSKEDFNNLKKRCEIIFDADPLQYHTDASLWRFLRAFRTVDDSFHALLKCNKWRLEYGVANISPEDPLIKIEIDSKKAIVLRHRDVQGRPIIYIPAKKHNVNERDIDVLTRFIVHILETACKKCHEDVIDNLCIIFDLKDFGLNCMDYQFVKNLIWLLSRYYPERLGVCLIINFPTIFQGCWAVIRTWLNDQTASKVFFIQDENHLCKYIHPEVIPENL